MVGKKKRSKPDESMVSLRLERDALKRVLTELLENLDGIVKNDITHPARAVLNGSWKCDLPTGNTEFDAFWKRFRAASKHAKMKMWNDAIVEEWWADEMKKD